MDEIIIPNKEELLNKILKFKKDKKTSIHIVSDFDKTLTKAFIKGNKVHGSYAILRENKYLSEDYSNQAFKLYEKYHPYEIDQNLPDKEKKVKMDQWWEEHLNLMIKSGINKDVFIDIAKKGFVHPRKGLREFTNLLKKNEIPLLIFSAGLGDIIKEFLIKKKCFTKNLKIIANFFKFEEDGKVNGYISDIVHVFNKKEIEHEENFPNRNNIILLGDNLGDLGMVKGIEYEEIIKIAFLNEKIEEQKEEYTKNFDLIILNDGTLKEVNKILKEILN